jgi:hypothetical protein
MPMEQFEGQYIYQERLIYLINQNTLPIVDYTPMYKPALVVTFLDKKMA